MEDIVEKPRALIVDDEAPARLRLRELLERVPSVAFSGECASGAEAVAAIRGRRPELLLLDVQMPVIDGFQVLENISDGPMPVTIFVTAYDRYALAAFDAHALDYLLKPFSDERFAEALGRAIALIELRQSGELASRLFAMLNSRISSAPNRLMQPESGRLAIKMNGRVVILKAGEIDWIEAAGVYVELHVGKKVFLHRESITRLESQLAPSRFVRIHRSTLVNLDRVRELTPAAHGQYHVLLAGGVELKLSKGYRHRLEEHLSQPL